MYGKDQCEPAWHSVVLDYKLVLLHNTCRILPAVCYITRPCSKASSVSQCENIEGGQKLADRSQLFVDRSSPNLTGMHGSPYRLTSFFPIVDIVFRCRDMFGQISKSVPKSGSCSQTVRGKCPGGVWTKLFK